MDHQYNKNWHEMKTKLVCEKADYKIVQYVPIYT